MFSQEQKCMAFSENLLEFLSILKTLLKIASVIIAEKLLSMTAI